VQPSVKHRQLRDHVFAPGLAAARREYGASQEKEADAAGVSWRAWTRWEKQDTRAPVDKLAAIAKRWKVSLDVLTTAPPVGPDAKLRALLREHGEDELRAAASRVIPAL
jgi:transcriptional regulator with XRE-family HTH domain